MALWCCKAKQFLVIINFLYYPDLSDSESLSITFVVQKLHDFNKWLDFPLGVVALIQYMDKPRGYPGEYFL